MGYIKARSRVSLMSGLGSGVALAIAAYTTLGSARNGLAIAAAIALFLLVTFAVRWSKTRALMPAGLMAGLSLLAAIAFSIGWMSAN
jgi:uncharacterized membrane protein (UPF0136 family)